MLYLSVISDLERIYLVRLQNNRIIFATRGLGKVVDWRYQKQKKYLLKINAGLTTLRD